MVYLYYVGGILLPLKKDGDMSDTPQNTGNTFKSSNEIKNDTSGRFRLKFMDDISEKMEAAERRNLERETKSMLEVENEFYNKAREMASLTPEERAVKYKQEKLVRKTEKKSWLYRICSVTPAKAHFFRPVTSTAEQQMVENWWFGITPLERQIYTQKLKTGLRGKIVRKVLAFAEYEHTKECKELKVPFLPEFYKYWFIYLIFALLLISLVVNYKLQSVAIASFGAFLCALVLFFSRLIKVRRGLGLKIFCPVTLGWLKALYIRKKFPEQKAEGLSKKTKNS